MSRKIISTFTAAAMSMSIALAVPVTVTAVSSVTVVSEAQAGLWSSAKLAGNTIKRKAKKVKRVVKRNCFSGHQGICGRSVRHDWGLVGRIGDPVRGTLKHDHRTK